MLAWRGEACLDAEVVSKEFVHGAVVVAEVPKGVLCGGVKVLCEEGGSVLWEGVIFHVSVCSLLKQYHDTTTQHPLWNLRHNHGAMDKLFRDHFGIQARLSTPCQHPLGDFTTTTTAASSLTDVYPGQRLGQKVGWAAQRSWG
jgi:hypothetical protein